MEKQRKQGNKRRSKITLRRVNTFLAAAVVVLAALSVYTASTHSTTKGDKTVSSTALGSNRSQPSSSSPVHTAGTAQEQESSGSPSAGEPKATPEPTHQPDQAPPASNSISTATEPPASSSTNVQATSPSGLQPVLPSSVKTKTVYLTFDDGPSRYSDQIAAILAKNDIHATFFAIGGNLKKYPKQVNRLLKAGHYVGLHSMSHDYNKLYKSGSSANFIEEFKQEQTLFKKITGRDVDLIRAPYGSAPQIDKQFRDDIVNAGFKLWDWTVDSEDWSYKNHPEKVIGQIKRQVHGNLNVILMHETKQTVQVLPQVIAYLNHKGYAFAVYKPEQHLVVNFAHDDRL
ncbi:hypothetical protein AWM70_08270 [Paenibacillus yonginensis]|uniref:NodB homology domain-containing protein n=1 Tax=Paenibacillus yonginensis TaxID=1462996 RepID=A0A1B1MZI6_9BACL|nr:polysaccharide deacetylase family protein [Paenibacillus yonginensis]ANS74582.1 hypothetical protein AWM70_08270 [Paenibacillus yonginensis]